MKRRDIVENWFKSLQDNICTDLEALDGKSQFFEDLWERSGGGGGRTRVITDGAVIEKGGVNFSAVYGDLPDKIKNSLKLPPSEFYATGVSIVLHPANPWVPIIHMNVRYFETQGKNPDDPSIWWIGGGIDLTPHYITKEDGKHIHETLKKVCDTTDSKYYNRFKKCADDYFFLKHRDETRGVGGIFYDRLNDHSEGKTFEELWKFHQQVGEAFVPIYSYYVEKYRNHEVTEANKKWQLVRRGRYVEFNLVWDKGTKFGLDTNGRTESILMSMPPQATWEYDLQPAEGSPEAETLKWLRKEIDWIGND